MEILLVAVLVVALVAGGTYFLVTARRTRGGVDLEPPPRPSAAAPPAAAPPPVASAESVEVPTALEPAAPEPPALEPETVGPETVEPETVAPAPPPRATFRDRLGKARASFSGYVGSVLGRGAVDAEMWDELEEALIRADVGVELSTGLLERVRAGLDGAADGAAVIERLKAEMVAMLDVGDRALHLQEGTTSIWLFVGVNGVGKTTTIGKLGQREIAEGHSVVMAAGDTFRAAAAEQLGRWAERTGASIVRGNEGGDPSAVIFDAVESAVAKRADLVLADTAGRLHTKANLMEELRKIRRVADKSPGVVTEVLLVVDATTGQNGLIQARQFTEAADLTGLVLTKLDGSAKGGIVLAIQHELGIPVKLVGLGEGPDDLVPFDPSEFVDALVGA